MSSLDFMSYMTLRLSAVTELKGVTKAAARNPRVEVRLYSIPRDRVGLEVRVVQQGLQECYRCLGGSLKPAV